MEVNGRENGTAEMLFQKAEKLWEQNQVIAGDDYDLDALENALFLYRQAAKQDHVDAMVRLGFHLREFGLPPSGKSESYEWLLRAADLGNTEAFYEVLATYYTTDAARSFVDERRLLELLLHFAELGDPGWQFGVGYRYIEGNMTDRDLAKGTYWIRKAAENGNSEALYYLGYCYLNGLGVDRDPEKAVEYFRAAVGEDAELTHPIPLDGLEYCMSYYYLGVCSENGLGTEYDRYLAASYYRKSIKALEDWSAEEEEGLVQDALSRFTERELGADAVLLRLAENGDAGAQYRLARFFDQEYCRFHAEKWYEKAVEQGHLPALSALANFYLWHNELNDEECRKAITLFQRMAERGDANAQVVLGVSYAGFERYICSRCSRVVEKNTETAAGWFRAAAQQGHPNGKFCYGMQLLDGEGVEKNETKGLRLLLEAWDEPENKSFFYWNTFSIRMAILKRLQRLQRDSALCDADRKAAYDWLYKVAQEEGKTYSDYYALIGECLFFGWGTGADKMESFQYYLRAGKEEYNFAVYDFSDIALHLANCYSIGDGTEKNEREAFRWYCKAAKQHNQEATVRVAECYESGSGVAPDNRKAAIFRACAQEIRSRQN